MAEIGSPRMGKGENLGEFEQLVMLALLRLGTEGYGMAVRRELRETGGRDVSVGTVYGTLDRLQEKGMISSTLTAPEPVRGGRSRRLFAVEPAGEAALAAARDMFSKMWHGVRLASPGGASR